MPCARQEDILPLWEPASSAIDSGRSSNRSSPEPVGDSNTTMLITVPEELEKALRHVVRDVDGVDEELRRKISQHLDREVGPKAVGGATATKPRRALPPSILAQVVPHVRRLRPPGDGGLLRLLLGGSQLVFPDTRGLPPKVGEEKRAYDERREWLLSRRAHKDYSRMTANIQTAPRESIRDIQEGFKFQAGMGANMVLAVVTAFIISFWASKYVVGQNKAHRMVIGLVGAVFMLLVELLVFVTRSMKADEVLEAARRDVEHTHTGLGVPRAASVPAPPRRRGRGVLDANGGGIDKSAGEYEMIPQGVGADEGDVSTAGNSEEKTSSVGDERSKNGTR